MVGCKGDEKDKKLSIYFTCIYQFPKINITILFWKYTLTKEKFSNDTSIHLLGIRYISTVY